MTLEFTKMTGSGNDFIVIDGRYSDLPHDLSALARCLCQRRLGVGADGMLLIQDSEAADFTMRLFNSDGSEAEMCGNAARCAAKLAFLRDIAPAQMVLETIAGLIEAKVEGDVIRVKLTDPKDVQLDFHINVEGAETTVSFANTGVPHVVLLVDDVQVIDVPSRARPIRFHERFAPAGTNVNFVQVNTDGSVSVRTYERGVEDETLACGTGVTASTVVCHLLGKVTSPVTVNTRGGEALKVFLESTDGMVKSLYLQGGARVVYEGTLEL